MTKQQHRTAALTWAVVYPLITGLMAVLDPILNEMPMPFRTFVLSAIMVPMMNYVTMPMATRKLRQWLDG